MSDTRLSCEHCSGTGHRPLTDVERNTRKAIGDGWSTTAEVGKRLTKIQGYGTTPTALINRLNDLVLRGLAERAPISGKSLRWRATNGRDIRGEAIEVEAWGRTMRGER